MPPMSDMLALPGDVGRMELQGIHSQVIFEEFTLTRPLQVLSSKVNLGAEAGAHQVLSVEIQSFSKVKELPLNVQLRKAQ